MRVKATGGGAFKYAEAFRQRLGVVLEREDEMQCAVEGANFLLQTIHHEAFTYENGTTSFVSADGEPASKGRIGQHALIRFSRLSVTDCVPYALVLHL